MVLFEMLTGRQPYLGQTVEEMFALHLTDPIPSVLPYRPDVPKALDDVVKKALAKSRRDRFADAGEFVEALSELALGPAVVPATPHRGGFGGVGATPFGLQLTPIVSRVVAG